MALSAAFFRCRRWSLRSVPGTPANSGTHSNAYMGRDEHLERCQRKWEPVSRFGSATTKKALDRGEQFRRTVVGAVKGIGAALAPS